MFDFLKMIANLDKDSQEELKSLMLEIDDIKRYSTTEEEKTENKKSLHQFMLMLHNDYSYNPMGITESDAKYINALEYLLKELEAI